MDTLQALLALMTLNVLMVFKKRLWWLKIFQNNMWKIEVDIFRNYVMDGSEIPYLCLSEQFCEALPQLLIASFVYIVNYPYSFPIVFVTIIFSGVSFIMGLITYLTSGGTTFRKLSDSEFIRIKVYRYDADFFKGRSPERISSPINILNSRHWNIYIYIIYIFTYIILCTSNDVGM